MWALPESSKYERLFLLNIWKSMILMKEIENKFKLMLTYPKVVVI